MRHTRLFLYSAAFLIALLAATVSFRVQGPAAYAHTTQRTTHQATQESRTVRRSTASTRTTQRMAYQVTCSGDGCDNIDPAQSGCSDSAYTVTDVQTPTADIQLRYSTVCGTNWGRVISNGDNNNVYLVLVQRIDGVAYGTKGLTGPIVWSRMVYAPTLKARACASINGAPQICTQYI